MSKITTDSLRIASEFLADNGFHECEILKTIADDDLLLALIHDYKLRVTMFKPVARSIGVGERKRNEVSIQVEGYAQGSRSTT